MYKLLILFIFVFFSYAKDITIQLKWRYQFQFAGFIMAKEKGFYKKEGLNVTLKEATPQMDVVKYVLNHKNSYGVGDSNLIYNISKGDKIKLLMPIYKTSPFVLTIVGEKIKSLKDIENSGIPISDFAYSSPLVLAMLKTQNVDINSLKIVSQNLDDSSLKKGAYLFYISNEVYDLKKSGVPYSIFIPKNYGINMYGDILFTSQYNVLNNPQEVNKMIKATKEGFKYAFSHIDETINVILKKYNHYHFTAEKLRYEAKILKPMLSDTFKFNIFRLNNIKDIFIALGVIKNKNFNIKDYIYIPNVLSLKEKSFIESHIIRCITTDTWEPFNLRKNGQLAGIAIDYWNIIKHKLHLRTTCKVAKDWNDVLNSIKNKQADITLSTTITQDRVKYAVFTKPYARYPLVLATRNNIGFIDNIASIKRNIVVGKNYTAEKIIKKYYPHLHIISVKDTDEALKLVSEGKAFAAVDILPVIAYKINKYQYSNLKISGKTPIDFDVRFMIRADYKELVPMINKAIDSITPAQKEKIYQKWVSVIYQNGWSFSEIKYIVIAVMFLIVAFIIWILFMRKEIIKQEAVEEELEKLATIDGLTNIYNRYKLDKSLEIEIEIAKRYKRPFSLIFFDIDHFKKINDTFGHKIGDKVLQTLANIVSKHIRKSDIFGRWGGEEFLIISPETTLDEAIILAEKLRKIISQYQFEDGLLNITCSFGIVEFSGDENIDEITKRVDLFLYKAKSNGRNRIEYEKKIEK